MKYAVTNAQWIAGYLKKNNIPVFGLPGGGNCELFKEMQKERIPFSLVLNEGNAVLIAAGFALKTGRPTCVSTTNSPGALNALPGVAIAKAMGAPLVLLTTAPKKGVRAFQASQESLWGMDVVKCYSGCVSSNRLRNVLEVHDAFKEAWKRRQPIHLQMGIDFQYQTASDWLVPKLRPLEFSGILEAYDKLIDTLSISVRPIFYIGKGAPLEILKIIKKIGSPYVLSPSARGNFDIRHEQCAGVFGFAAHASAWAAMEFSDSKFIIGAKLSELSTANFAANLFSGVIFQVDDDVSNIQHVGILKEEKDFELSQIFTSSLSVWVKGLKELNLPKRDWGGKFPKLEIMKTGEEKNGMINPRIFFSEAHKIFPDIPFFFDTGNCWSWSHFFKGNAFIEMHHGAMGSSMVGLGYALASRRPIALVLGDGAFMMYNHHELATAIAMKLPVLYIILQDNFYGMVRSGGKLMGIPEMIGTGLPCPDFVRVSDGYGADTFFASSMEEVWKLNFKNIKKATVLVLKIDPSVQPLLASRIAALKQELKTNSFSHAI